MMNFIIVIYMAFMCFAMFSIDLHLYKMREIIKDIKQLIEIKKKYTEEEK